jgi:membrane-associated phospholipid phosphatase
MRMERAALAQTYARVGGEASVVASHFMGFIVGDQSDTLFEAVSWPGQPPQNRFVSLALIAIVRALVGQRAALWQLGALGIIPAGEAVKRIVNRPRPAPARFNVLAQTSHGPSFPSTHVSTYTVQFGLAGWLLSRRLGRVAALPAIALIALIGPARVRSGEHRPSDVAAGYVLGAAWLGVMAWLTGRDRALRAELNRQRRESASRRVDPPPALKPESDSEPEPHGITATPLAASAAVSAVTPKAMSPLK